MSDAARLDDRSGAEIEIREVDELTPLTALAALDALLLTCRGDLVGPRGYLEPMDERALDAQGARILLWAGAAGRPVGLVDAALHHPEPGELTVSQLAVRADFRGRGLGRRLVRAALEEARRRDVDPGAIFAAVRPRSEGAHAFWSRLGFVDSPDHPKLLWVRAEAL